SYESQAESIKSGRERKGIGPILATRTHRAESEGRGGAQGSTRSKLKYARAFSVLFTLMERAGFTALASPLPWGDLWHCFHRELARVTLPDQTDRTWADFCWMPGRLYAGGLRDLNARLLDRWTHPKFQAEGWVFGIVD